MKTCRKCGTEKALTEYTVARRNPDGLHSWCKDCWNAYTRERWASGGLDKAKKAKSDAEWRKANPEKSSAIWRRNNLKRKYGITVEQYDAMLAAQGGACAVCRGTESGDSRFGTFAVDHDHVTGEVRALLCSNCNRAFGLLGEDVDVIMALASYALQFRNVIGTSA